MERNRQFLEVELITTVQLLPYMEEKPGERVLELKDRFWDQVFPWDYYQRVHEAGLSDEKRHQLGKPAIASKEDKLMELYKKMKAEGRL